MNFSNHVLQIMWMSCACRILSCLHLAQRNWDNNEVDEHNPIKIHHASDFLPVTGKKKPSARNTYHCYPQIQWMTNHDLKTSRPWHGHAWPIQFLHQHLRVCQFVLYLWWTNSWQWKFTIFHGKIHYFYGHVQLPTVSSPEGIPHEKSI